MSVFEVREERDSSRYTRLVTRGLSSSVFLTAFLSSFENLTFLGRSAPRRPSLAFYFVLLSCRLSMRADSSRVRRIL